MTKNKILSMLLVFSLITAFLPTFALTAQAVDTIIQVELRNKFVSVGETEKLTVTDGEGDPITDVVFKSLDSNTAQVDALGNVTGVSIGKTQVIITRGSTRITVDIPVVGPNLLTRAGIKHGEFEAGVYHETETPSSTAANFFWFNYYNTSATLNMYSYQQHSLIENVPSYVSESTNILKYTFDDNDLDVPRRDIRLSTFTEKGLVGVYDGSETDHRGGIPVDRTKIYEFSGWLKSDNTTTLATDLGITVYYYNDKTLIPQSGGTAITPWKYKSGDVDWSQFVVGARPIDIWDSGYILSANPRITTTMTSKIGDILFADFSFNEVIYEKLEFLAASGGAFIDLEPGKTLSTTVRHLSNTGNLINESKNESGAVVPIEVRYNSSDESVATVSSTGVITAEGPGSANITATSTIAGVTRTGTIAVSVSPLHYNFWKLANNGVQAEGKTPIADVTEFKHTTKDDPAEIWPNSSIVTDPWHYVDKNATQFEFTHDLSALTLQGPTGSWARLKVRVTQPGLYRASSVNAMKTNAVTRVYLAPESAVNPMAPEYSIGVINANDWDVYTPKVEILLGCRELVIGDYVLTYELVADPQGTGTPYFRFGGFKLSSISESLLPEKSVLIDPLPLTGIIKGGNERLLLSAQSSDGSYEDLFAAEITAESEDDSVATVVIETSADTLTRSVIIDAVSEGSTTIEIQVSMNGKLIGSKHIPVVVDAQDAPGKGMLCISITDCEDVEIQDADIIGEGLTPDFEMGRDNEFNVGTEFILTAGDVEGKRFVCWQDANSKRILAINKTISFKLGSGTYLKAVYTSTENGTLVQFVDRNYKVLQRNYLNETSTSVTAPSPYSVGYDFNVWKSEQMDVQGGDTVTSEQIGGLDTVFIADYSKSSEEYTIKISGSTSDGTYIYLYDEKVSVTAAAPQEGYQFAYWTRDGKIISYSPNYSFNVGDDTSIIAVFLPEGTVVKQIPRLLSDKVKIVSDSIIFASERSVPSGYELIESGILLTDIGADANEESFNLENIDVIKAVSQSSRTNGQFTVRRDRALGTWYARAYLIYRDIAQNKYKVIYGNIISGTV